jgi:hypothetical protein
MLEPSCECDESWWDKDGRNVFAENEIVLCDWVGA